MCLCIQVIIKTVFIICNDIKYQVLVTSKLMSKNAEILQCDQCRQLIEFHPVFSEIIGALISVHYISFPGMISLNSK